MPTSKKAYMDGLIDTRMLRALFGAAREHGISSEELHDVASFGFGKSSLKDLTRREAYRMLDGIRGKVQTSASGVRGPRRHAMAVHGHKDYDHSGDPVYLVNDRELQMLREAAERRGWDEAALQKFCQRQISADRPRTMAEFNKVFQPLKTMNRRMGL
jgi:hypothetical protein